MKRWACNNFKVSEDDPAFCANCHDFASSHKGPTPGAVRSFRLPEKGEKGGECNRGACNNRPARHYNHVMDKFYCTPCARKINDAARQYGEVSLCDGFGDTKTNCSACVHFEQYQSLTLCRLLRRAVDVNQPAAEAKCDGFFEPR